MTIELPDSILADSGLSERDLVIEIACRLYNADKITKPAATRMTGLTRPEFEGELRKRGLPWIRIRDEDAMADLRQVELERKST